MKPEHLVIDFFTGKSIRAESYVNVAYYWLINLILGMQSPKTQNILKSFYIGWAIVAVSTLSQFTKP